MGFRVRISPTREQSMIRKVLVGVVVVVVVVAAAAVVENSSSSSSSSSSSNSIGMIFYQCSNAGWQNDPSYD